MGDMKFTEPEEITTWRFKNLEFSGPMVLRFCQANSFDNFKLQNTGLGRSDD